MFQIKMMMLQGWKPVSQREYLGLRTVERDFYSLRQTDAPRQQEVAPEEETSAP